MRKNYTQVMGITELSPESNSTELGGSFNSSANAAFCSIEYVELLLIIFRADKASEAISKRLAAWENQAYDYVMNNYSNPYVDVQVITFLVYSYI